MQRHALLLDIDGVIVQQPRLLQRVEKNAVQYTRHKTRVKDAQVLNMRLYKQHGHTLLGLQKEFGVTDNIIDFNKHVYTDELLGDLNTHLHSSEFTKDIIGLDTVLLLCSSYNIPVYLFSNASFAWCLLVAERLGISPWNMIPGYDLTALKPKKYAYRNAYNYVSRRERNTDVNLMFLDDSLRNLIPVQGHPLWTPMHFSLNDNNYNVTNIRSFIQLAAIIAYNEHV